MEEKKFFSQDIEELDLDAMEGVVGGKKKPYVRSLGKDVNVRTGPGTEYPAVARLGYLDEVPVVSKKIVRDGRGHYWAKVKVAVSQTGYVEGWVCSKYAEGCWN